MTKGMSVKCLFALSYVCVIVDLCLPLVGVPVIMSLPHFLNGDPEYINAIGGMHPDPVNHQTQLDVEPVRNSLFENKSLSM